MVSLPWLNLSFGFKREREGRWGTIERLLKDLGATSDPSAQDSGHLCVLVPFGQGSYPLPPTQQGERLTPGCPLTPLGQAEVTAVEDSGLSWPLLKQLPPCLGRGRDEPRTSVPFTSHLKLI